MKDYKKYIIIIICVIVIILCALVIINKKAKKNENVIPESYTTDAETPEIFVRGNFTEATEQEYYNISQYITNYLNALAFDDFTSAYQMLDKQYATNNQINGSKVSELKNSDKYQEFEASDMQKLDLTEERTIFVVHGNIREKNSETGVKENFDCIINVDNKKSIFSITPYKIGTLDIEKLNINDLTENINDIEENDNNKYSISIANQKLKAIKLFDKYISEALFYQNTAYESLDEEYKKIRFGSLEKYKEYIEDNKEYLQKLIVDSYGVTKKDDYTVYRIMDNYGNIYLFHVTKLLNYKLMLDEYTIPTEDFLKAYNQGNVQKKVSLNIGKFFNMINAKDYDSAYKCLAEGFKQNYFKDIAEFKNYMNETFFESNSLEGVNFTNEGDTYIITVNVSDYTKKDSNIVPKTFIMQLGEGTDFVMSFNVN